MDTMLWVWLAVIILTAVCEAATAGLVSIWFCAGAAAAFISAVFKLSPAAQLLIFIVVSAATLAATRPLVKRLSERKTVPTNADRVIGGQAKVTEKIDNINSAGAVYADGKTWAARSVSGGIISEGETVRVVKIEGVKLFVEKINDTDNEEVKL